VRGGDGEHPLDVVEVARYRVGDPPPPRRPSYLRVRRSGSQLMIRWGKSVRARQYNVRVTSSHGHRMFHVLGGGRHALRVRGISPRARVEVRVWGATHDHLDGRARRVVLRARGGRTCRVTSRGIPRRAAIRRCEARS
jgi:hypothetical protein